jgi:HlyD family secretion protein
MTRKIWAGLAALSALTLVGVVFVQQQGAASAKETNVAQKPKTESIVAAGRVEPVSEEITIRSELDGKLKSVAVEEGTDVRRGQVLATLENGDYIARIEIAKSEVRENEAELERLRNGARVEEKREAAALVREAEAQVDNARAERERRQWLLTRGAISKSEFEVADRDYLTAQARLEALRERQKVSEAQTRPEDVQRAEAQLERSRGQVAEAEARLEKTYLRSPVNGRVLRKFRKSGESVTANGTTPVLSIGDCSTLRIRVDVDETDVARLFVGQRASVTAEAYGDKKFTGHVVRIGQALGRKNIRTDEPTERVDKKILETLVELDPGQTLPIGLRVDAFLEQAQ